MRHDVSSEPLKHETVHAIAKATGQVVWLLTSEGFLMADSPSWCAFTGQSPEEARGPGWLDALHAEDREASTRALRAAHAQGRPYEFECRLHRSNQRYTRARIHGVPIQEAEGPPTGWVATLNEVWVDVSVRHNEERLRLATQSARVAVWEYDFVAGQMTRTENHDGLYGLEAQQVWQYDLFTSATHPEDREASDRIVQTACGPGGADEYAVDFRVVWPDGSIHWLACSGRILARDAEGRATLVRGVLIDVTRLKDVEAELREAVRVRDEFLQIASHELNTPLTPLSLKLESLHRLAERGPAPPEVLKGHVDVARRQVKRLAGLIKDLLDVTRLSRGKLQLTLSEGSLSERVRAVTERFAAEAQRNGCRLELTSTGDVTGRWDLGRLEQVVENLLSNALKYGQGRPVHLHVGADGGSALLRVRDEGMGIEPEALPRIFDKFERAPSARYHGGLGLGLYIAKQIVDGHGGTLSVVSTPGQGATFEVRLPWRAREEAPRR
ncbi:PAS domain-containing sensor histidine kinase [Pyxidicoccus fallax]|uniref:histidine kinase n=1 Tax=Pyxidicoccus fallax TaxID=394095 RepID=A0A848LF65_9BACT|nr:ATP-binding protein [Pyxidicoccus fallax]NMO16932.1 PAS domain-containing protein [Pyxidicoccus fallax]NPC81169.1 PAS domain-containing sensor histidine kinase [Pyxidicoccus fallax]